MGGAGEKPHLGGPQRDMGKTLRVHPMEWCADASWGQQEAEVGKTRPSGAEAWQQPWNRTLRTLLGLTAPTPGPLSLELKGLAPGLPGAPDA